jgi:hypothetical protein
VSIVCFIENQDWEAELDGVAFICTATFGMLRLLANTIPVILPL